MRVVVSVVAILALLLVPASVSALGLAYQPLENKTLPLAAGENYFFKLTLQNEQNESATVNVTMQSAVASLVGGGILEIPAKTYDRFVYFNITVPSDAKAGERYDLNYSVAPVGRGDGQVPFAIRYDRTISILVTGEPSPPVLAASPAAPPQVPADIGQVQRERPQPRPWWMTGAIIPIILLLLVILAITAMLIWRRSGLLSRRLRPLVSRKHAPTPRAPPGKEFILTDGRALRDLRELRDAIASMDDESFRHHVNVHRNDFSNWVEDALAKPKLAERLARERTRSGMRKILDKAL